MGDIIKFPTTIELTTEAPDYESAFQALKEIIHFAADNGCETSKEFKEYIHQIERFYVKGEI